MDSTEIIICLKEKYETVLKLYNNANDLNIKAIKECSKLYLLLAEIKTQYPETVELINTRLGEMGHD